MIAEYKGMRPNLHPTVFVADSADVIGNIVYRDYGAYKDGDGDRQKGTGFDVLSGMVKGTFRPTDTSELKLGWVGASDGWH